MTFTASSFERARRCPGSVILPQANTSSVYADTGNEGHDVLSRFLDATRLGHEYVPPTEWWPLCEALLPIAAFLRSEVAVAYSVATGAGRVLGYNIGRAYKLEMGEVAGTADLAGSTETHAIVIDLKTGWGEVAPAQQNRQLRLLALAACAAFGKQSAQVAILRCHEGGEPFWDWADLDVFDLEETQQDLLDTANKIAEQAGRSIPDVAEGSWCKYCPAAPHCPAKTALIRRLADGSEAQELELMKPLSPETAGIAYRRLQYAKALLKPIEAAIMACLGEHGELPLPDGKVLRKVIGEGNEKLDGEVVWQVLSEIADPSLADAAVERKATKKRLGEALRSRYGRKGAETERKVIEEVRKRGGAERGTTERLEEVPAERRLAR